MPLKVIGLISGGKDSLFSLAHCVQNGHQIVALANLYPSNVEPAGKDHGDEGLDLDSFMYQTVGHSVIPLYSEALGLPVYRRCITGTAIQNGRYYETSDTMAPEDETEDMYELVKEVLLAHPDANALSAGAILSTYQRTRVESVATRLGLTPLAYLWQYPALPPPNTRDDSLTGLLDDMSASGCDARIIKIASGGVSLKVAFSNVCDPSIRTRLISGMTPFFADSGQEFWFRGAVLGEGGEYETLALDGPDCLWKRSIKIDGSQACEAAGGTVYVRLGEACLIERTTESDTDIPLPAFLDKRFQAVQDQVVAMNDNETNRMTRQMTHTLCSTRRNILDTRSHFVKSSDTIQLFNLTSPGSTAAEQLDSIIATLPFVLSTIATTCSLPESYLQSRNIIHAMLLLHSMEDFASVNQIYVAKLWPKGVPNPPARVTVATLLPHGAKVSLSLLYDVSGRDAESRKGLHVQSHSYWAPANIGPYSQAISTSMVPYQAQGHSGENHPEVVQLAGQIPLIPQTMTLLTETFVKQAILALQHLWRVGQERGVDFWSGSGVAFVASDNLNDQGERENSNAIHKVQKAVEVWVLSHCIDETGVNVDNELLSGTNRSGVSEQVKESDDESFDVWDLQQRSRGFTFEGPKMTVGQHLHKLPSRAILAQSTSRSAVSESNTLPVPPLIIAEVLRLPRDAPIEWWSQGVAGVISRQGQQNVKVRSFFINSQRCWALSGITMEVGDSERRCNDDAADESLADDLELRDTTSRSKLSVFATFTIDTEIETNEAGMLPKSVEQLAPYLMEATQTNHPLQFEVVAAHSFLNLDHPSIAAIHESLTIVQNSCIIPCAHVWFRDVAQRTSLSSASPKNESDEREVAASIIMRLEAFLDSP